MCIYYAGRSCLIESNRSITFVLKGLKWLFHGPPLVWRSNTYVLQSPAIIEYTFVRHSTHDKHFELFSRTPVDFQSCPRCVLLHFPSFAED